MCRQVFLEDGRFKVAVLTSGMPYSNVTRAITPVVLDAYEQRYDDGSWHSATVALGANRATTVLDGYPAHTQRLMKFTSGVEYLFGGQ